VDNSFFNVDESVDGYVALDFDIAEGNSHMLRRDFLLGMVMAPTSLWATAKINLDRARYSVVLGPVTHSNLQFSVLHRRNEPLQYQISTSSQALILKPSHVKVNERVESDWLVDTVEFSQVPTSHFLALNILNEDGLIKDHRPLKLNILKRNDLTVAALSCAAGYLYDSSIWQHLNQSNPDLVIFLGDNIYGDRPDIVTKIPADPQQLWQQYVKGRLQYDFFFRRELVPSFATWDDHDFGIDNGDSTYRYANESLQMFKVFWPQERSYNTKDLQYGPGVSARWSLPGFDLVTLDGRSFRTNSKQNSGPVTVLGEEQKTWLYKQLRLSRRPLWLINGQQFFGSYRAKNSMDYDYPMDFEWLMANLRAVDRPVGFLSGDVHYSELMDIEESLLGRGAVEITSSSMHSITVPGHHKLHRNPRRRDATSFHNFVLLDLVCDERKIFGQMKAIGAAGETIIREPFRLT
jgi:alkaline phosphatase D